MYCPNLCHAIRQQGFTFLEVMIALAISVIVLTMAVPSMRGFLGQSEISATTNQLVFSLQTARSEAIKRAAPVGLCASVGSLDDEPVCSGNDYAAGWIVYEDANADGDRDTGEDIIQRVEPQTHGFTLIGNTVFAQQIYFGSTGSSMNPTGVPLSGAISVEYADGLESRSVNVSANGRVSSSLEADD